MKIGDISKAAGVPTKTIRYYEEIGLLPKPNRAANGYRTYEFDAIERLRFIRDAQATGLTLSEIASVQELREHGSTTCDHVTGLMERHLRELDDHILKLQQTRGVLADMIGRAQSLDPAECTDPHRCQTIEAGSISARHTHFE